MAERLSGMDDSKVVHDTMVLLMMKKQAATHHEISDAMRRKVAEEHEQVRQKVLEIRGRGQWALCRGMRKGFAAPLVSVKRTEKGPQGKARGTIATRLAEVDAIIRNVYGEIY